MRKVLLVLAFLLPVLASAQVMGPSTLPVGTPVMNDPDAFTATYQALIPSWISLIAPYATEIFYALAGLEIAFFCCVLWFESRGDLSAAMALVLRKILGLGLFLTLLQNAGNWMGLIINAFTDIGKNVTGMAGLTPTRILAQGNLMRGLTRSAGADVADTDCSRVLRLPGFTNQKLDTPHWITRENLHQRIARPEDFPRFEVTESVVLHSEKTGIDRTVGGVDNSQSAKDYGFARRALERGASPAEVEAAIAAYRVERGRDAERYARVTVDSALRKGRGLSLGM